MEEVNISSINAEIQNTDVNTLELINSRLQKYPENSIVWSACNFVEITNDNGVKNRIIWEIGRILNDKKEDCKKYRYSREFSEIKEGEYYVECILCNKSHKYHPRSANCPKMFAHLIKCHQYF